MKRIRRTINEIADGVSLESKKEKCKRCGSSELKDGVMPEDGEEYPIKICITCGWWG